MTDASTRQVPPIRLALPENAIVVQPSMLPERDDVRETLQTRFGHLEEFDERSEALLDTLDIARRSDETTGAALFVLLSFGEGEHAVTATLSVLSVDVSSMANLDPSGGDGGEATGDADAMRELDKIGQITTTDGRIIEKVVLSAGSALCVTTVEQGRTATCDHAAQPPQMRIDYYVPRAGSTDAVVLSFHSRAVLFAGALGEMARDLASSLEFTDG